ncbi:MAG: DUF4145 domain-containing protein [candidate division Zixibacteria bacterium]|nr:DUF4145 domain-containing protein [candidate division Zixibacteria bacterium]
MLARSSLQAALRNQGASGANLKQEIDGLAEKGILPPIMKEWSHEVRELGNDTTHPAQDQAPTDPQDAKDLVRFLDFLFECLYDLPHQILEYRSRKKD